MRYKKVICYFNVDQQTRSHDPITFDKNNYDGHKNKREVPRAIVLHCYFDEFQVANPLGSKTKTHKLGKLLNGFHSLLHLHLEYVQLNNNWCAIIPEPGAKRRPEAEGLRARVIISTGI